MPTIRSFRSCSRPPPCPTSSGRRASACASSTSARSASRRPSRRTSSRCRRRGRRSSGSRRRWRRCSRRCACRSTSARFLAGFAHEHLASGDALRGVAADVGAMAWGCAAASSRAFRLKQGRAMLPLIDSGNHAFDGNAEVRSRADGGVELVASTAIAAGEEVTFSYGALSNDDYLLDYGFIPHDNPYDTTELAWGANCELLDAARGASGGGDAGAPPSRLPSGSSRRWRSVASAPAARFRSAATGRRPSCSPRAASRPPPTRRRSARRTMARSRSRARRRRPRRSE